MEYLAYNYGEQDTFQGIANAFGITVSELMRINNIHYPYPEKPSDMYNPSEQIKVPDTITGIITVEDKKKPLENEVMQSKGRPVPRDMYMGGYSGVGAASQYKCYLEIFGLTPSIVYFPCFPESVSDTSTSNFAEMNPLGRSEPFQIYQNSGPREVSVSFTMHKEMAHTTPIEALVNAVKATTYPLGSRNATSTFNYSSSNGIDIVPKVHLVIGRSIDITGVIKGSVGIKWYGPINKFDRYSMVDLDFTVTECTGDPKTAGRVANWDGDFSWIEDWNR